MSTSKPKSGTQTIFWWTAWITLTIVSFFIAAAIWTPIIARTVGSTRETKGTVLWVFSVFGTWMIILVPLIIVMYSKVDKVYEDARIRRETAALRFRSIKVDPAKRKLSPAVASQLKNIPQTIEGGHLVTLTLQSGRKVENVFVSEGSEILGIYDANELTFEGRDVTKLEVDELKNPPAFLATRWLRLDGALPPE